MSSKWNERLRSILAGTVQIGHEMKARYGFEPEAGSVADEEQRVDLRAGKYWLVRETYSLAESRLVAASDHLTTLADLLARETGSVFAVSALARTALETSARASWLLDPAIDRRTRGLRGLAELLYAFQEEAKFPIEQDEDGELDPGFAQFRDFVSARVETLAVDAESAGIEVIRSPSTNKPLHLQEMKRPGATEVIRNEVGVRGELAYRDLSGVAHGNPTSLVRQTEVVPEEEHPTGAQFATRAGISLTRPSLAQDRDVPRLSVVWRAYVRSLTRKARCYGWDLVDLKAWTTEAGREFGRLMPLGPAAPPASSA